MSEEIVTAGQAGTAPGGATQTGAQATDETAGAGQTSQAAAGTQKTSTQAQQTGQRKNSQTISAEEAESLRKQVANLERLRSDKDRLISLREREVTELKERLDERQTTDRNKVVATEIERLARELNVDVETAERMYQRERVQEQKLQQMLADNIGQLRVQLDQKTLELSPEYQVNKEKVDTLRQMAPTLSIGDALGIVKAFTPTQTTVLESPGNVAGDAAAAQEGGTEMPEEWLDMFARTNPKFKDPKVRERAKARYREGTK